MRIAIVGTGIAGLGAAYALSRVHDVVVFEQATRAGGHTNTVEVADGDGTLGLDTGFIVHNEPNYPNLIRLFEELGVQTQPSEMSFSVSCARCDLEYSGRRPYAQSSNLLRPGFHRLIWDVTRFLRTSEGDLESGRLDGRTLDEYVTDRGYSQSFRDHFLVPLTAALWSTPPTLAADFPIDHAVRFFEHHGMLGFRRYRWRTVVGGSSGYVTRMLERLGERVRLGTGVKGVRRHAEHVDVATVDGSREAFDAVVLATHSDESLRLLDDPSDEETRLLSEFPYLRNDVVLHSDERFLPRRRAARASWNFQIEDCRSPSQRPTMTYYLNRLQRLDSERHWCVTLNRSDEIATDTVQASLSYDHPLFTRAGVRAQQEVPSLQGVRRTYFAGAWQGYGFHEDGLASGLRVARLLGGTW